MNLDENPRRNVDVSSRITRRRMLDLCCGKKGASSAFERAGWEVVGVDLDLSFDPDITADVRDLARLSPDGLVDEMYGLFDFVWASPPCQEFSLAPRCRRPDDPDVSILLACLDIIERLAPRFWCVENVRGAVRFFGPPTLSDDRTWFFWGQFPGCIEIPPTRKKWIGGKNRRHKEAARIPDEISERFRSALDAHYSESWTSLDWRRHGPNIIERMRHAVGSPARTGSSSQGVMSTGPGRRATTSGVGHLEPDHVAGTRSTARPRREIAHVDGLSSTKDVGREADSDDGAWDGRAGSVKTTHAGDPRRKREFESLPAHEVSR